MLSFISSDSQEDSDDDFFDESYFKATPTKRTDKDLSKNSIKPYFLKVVV